MVKRLEKKAKYNENSVWIHKRIWNERSNIVMRFLCERRLEFDEELFVFSVDFEKAFDRVNKALLKKIGVDCRDRRLNMNL